jgi:hypothetical protein
MATPVKACPKCHVPYGDGDCQACAVSREFQHRPLPPTRPTLVAKIVRAAASEDEASENLARADRVLEGTAGWKPYEPPADIPLGPHRPPCSCADGGVRDGERCTRCWGWLA